MTTIISGMTTVQFLAAINDNFTAEKYKSTVSTIAVTSGVGDINTNFETIRDERSSFIPTITTLSNGLGSTFISRLNQNFNNIHVPMRDFTGITKYEGNPIVAANTFKINDEGDDVYQVFINPNINNKIGDTYYALASANNGTGYLYKHVVLYTSDDLLTWTLYSSAPRFSSGVNDDHLILVKGIIKKDNLWYAFYSAANASNQYNIFLATSPDFITWTKYSADPVYQRSQDSNRNVYNPCVIQIGSLYYMYYVSYVTVPSFAAHIAYATSTDLINWTYGGIALGYEVGDWAEFPIDPYVIRNSDGYYEMSYSDSALDTPTQGIGYAISEDGITWLPRLTKILDTSFGEWDGSQVGEPIILEKEDGNTYLYYVGLNAVGSLIQTGVAIV